MLFVMFHIFILQVLIETIYCNVIHNLSRGSGIFNWGRIVREERNDCESNGMRKVMGEREQDMLEQRFSLSCH